MPGEPICTFIAFCDLVITEAGTGKNSLIGTFPSLAAPSFPFPVPQITIHVTISNFGIGSKDSSVAVNLKQQSTGVVVGSRAVQLPVIWQKSLSSMGSSFNLNMPFQNVIFPAAGAYLCEILFDGESIGDRILELKLLAPQQAQLPPA